MKTIKRLFSFLLAAMLLLTSGVTVFAGDSLETALNKVNLYIKQDKGPQLLTWKGIIDAENFAPAVIVYRTEDGQELPAYCANPNRPGVEDLAVKTYDVDVDQLDTDPHVWGVITNGYPYKSPQELGVSTDYEAYYATKMAVWATVHDNYSNLSDWQANGEHNEPVLQAMKSLVAKGQENQYVYATWLAVNPATPSAVDDGEYLTQEYTIKSNVEINSFRVVLDGDVPEGTKITDTNDNEKDTFDGSETNIKIKIPKTGESRNGSFRVIVKGNLENKAVMFGLSHDAQKQDYYVAPLPSYNGDSWADVIYTEVTGTDPEEPDNPDIPEAKGSLQILKVASGTTKGLAGAVFKVEVDGKTIGHYVTDKNGEIQIDDISGTVSITEEVPPLGYVLDKNNHKDVEIEDSDKPTVVTFTNEEMAELEITKIVADTGEGLSGAAIRVAYDGGSDFYDVYTNASGKATLTNLKSGTVEIFELSSPDGYVLDENHQSIKLEAGKKASVTLKNKSKPGLVIKKYDEDTGLPLANAEFSVAVKGGKVIYEGMTDKSGEIRLHDLDVLKDMENGVWLTVTELAAPKGYLKAAESKDVYLEAGKTVEIKFDNRLRPSLQIMKLDVDTKEPLEGAVFVVKNTEGETIGEYQTDSTGTVVVRDLDETIVTVEEKSAPENYLLDDEPHKDIQLEWGKTKTVIFENKKKPVLEIQKIDAVTKEPVENVKFKITKTEDNTVSEYVTDKDGKITIESLDEAVYTVEEISVPDEYILDTQHKEIELEGGKTKTLIFENTKKPTLIVTKTNALTEKPIPNTTFKIEYEGENGGIVPLGTYKTDKNGQIVLDNVDEGWYIVTEIRPAQGFQLPSNPVTRKYLAEGENAYNEISQNNNTVSNSTNNITINSSQNNTTASETLSNSITVTSGNDYIGEEIPNYPLNSIVIKKTDAITSEMLEGTVFEVRKVSEDISGNSGTIIGRYTTDSSGIIVITGLEAGAYIIEEVQSPTHYLISENSKQQAWLKADGTSIVEVAFANYPYGSLLITKVDGLTNQPLGGVKFKVTTGNGTVEGNTNGIYETDSNGEILIPNLKPDSYVVTEVETIENYAIDTTPQTVHIGTDGRTYKVSFKNYPYGSLLITKVDGLTNQPLGGVKFKVETSDGTVGGNANGIYETDSNGEILIPNLKPDSYVVTEIETLENYELDTTPQTIDIGTDGEVYKVSFKNQPKSSLVIFKKDADTGEPLQGVKFKVTNADGTVIGTSNGIFTTDQNGKIVISNIGKQTVTIEEVETLEGYALETQQRTVSIDYGKTYTEEFTNTRLASLVIKKIDEYTNEPLSGVKFLVEKQNGEHIGEYTTDSTGTINVPTLEPDWYIVRELKTKDGYILDETPKTVEVKKSVPTVVTFTNKPLSGIKIIKTDSETGKPLEGVEFSISKMNGEKIGSFQTDKEGMIYVSNLEDGYYTVTETEGLEGYHWNQEPKTVEVKSGKQTIVEVENQPYSGLVIEKTNSRTGKPIEGVEFLVTKFNGEQIGYYKTDEDGLIIIEGLEEGTYLVKETEAAAGYQIDNEAKEVEIRDGKRTTLKVKNDPLSSVLIRKIDSVTGEGIEGVKFLLYDSDGEPIGQFESDDEGYVWIKKELPEGRYKLHELESAEGYISDDSVKTFYVHKGRTTEIIWKNTPQTGQIVVTKRSSEFNELTGLPAGSPLEGAVFEIYNTTGNMVDRMTSDSRGIAASKGLPVGVYIVKEVSSPRYYALNDRELLAEIRHNGDIVRFEVLNGSIDLNITVQKKGPNSASPGQNINYEVYGVTNGSSGKLENFYIHDRIPTDATRVSKITTGTYNERMYYKITYKTNYRDYMVLADNLLTSNDYEFSLHSNALGLQNGEYVTDVRLEFPQASPGFTQTKSMRVFCQVLPSLPKDYRITNRVDVGGRYGNEWESATTSWNTTVWTNETTTPLPKTGY